MSQSYTKDCIFCGKKIRMSDELGKWRPYNLEDNSEHDCKKQNGNENTYEPKEKISSEPKKYTLEEVVKKLSDIGIIINVERLMKQ